MQKTRTHQDVLNARRMNNMQLAVLFTIIVASMVFAFGTGILYIVAIFGLPLVVVRIWEEINNKYVAQKPQGQ